MSAQKPLTPEETASIRAWRYGGTLDWASLILSEIGYPVEENRWFVDAVCGVYQQIKFHYKDAGVPITHGALAKRAKRFKNKAQASDLARAAIERDFDWQHLRRMMIFDIERPKPHERRGKDKRAATKYTDYLTPAAVFAQDREHVVKKADAAAWKSSKYRGEKRAEILAEAIKLLPQFESAEDMPPGPPPKSEPTPQTLSEYVEGQQARELAARRRIVDKIAGEHLTDTEEIDARLAALDTYYSRSKTQLEKEYASARAVLLGMRSTRLVTPIHFTDPEEVAAEVDEKLGTETGKTGHADWLQDSLFSHNKGKAHLTPSVEPDNPSPPPPSGGSNTYKGSPGVSR